MSRLEQTQSRYRGLCLNAIANQMDDLLANAEANELSYLEFAHQLAEHELTERTRTRIARHLKQA